jgi:hypothetical protein
LDKPKEKPLALNKTEEMKVSITNWKSTEFRKISIWGI